MKMLQSSWTISIFVCARLFSLLRANPIVGLFDSKCEVVTGDCPHENVTFWLYSKENRSEPIELDALNLNPWDFQPPRPLKILLHGYTGHRDFSPNSHIRPMLLEHEDVYVISPDYGRLVPLPCYLSAVQNLPLASKCLGQLINNLVDQGIVQNEHIHVIGFSLGAQVAGQTANYVKRKLKRITGLDPAKPMFITVGSESKLDPSDAEFVDVIHTDVLGRGMLRSTGHADFYPNIGLYQPGCQDENADDPGSCNHDRAPTYYAESIRNSHGFWSYACPTWLHYIFGLCVDNGNDAVMGYHVDSSKLGSFFLKTAHISPYALGPLVKSETEGVRDPYLRFSYITNLELADFEPQLQKAFEDLQQSDDSETQQRITQNTDVLEQIKLSVFKNLFINL